MSYIHQLMRQLFIARERKLGRVADLSKGYQRLKPAMGPGSINCKAEIMNLVRAGRGEDAIALYDADRHQCPKIEAPIPEWVMRIWKQNAKNS